MGFGKLGRDIPPQIPCFAEAQHAKLLIASRRARTPEAFYRKRGITELIMGSFPSSIAHSTDDHVQSLQASQARCMHVLVLSFDLDLKK